MSSPYGKLRPTNGWDRFVSLGHPSKCQRVSRLGFVTGTAAMSLTGGQPNLARWPFPGLVYTRLIYIYVFGDSCPLTEFCHVQNPLCVQVLRSPILTALLHGTRAASVSQNLRRATRNGITELRRERHLYSAGRPSRWASANIPSLFILPVLQLDILKI